MRINLNKKTKARKYVNLKGKIHALRFSFSLRLHYFLEMLLSLFSLLVIVLNFAEKSQRSILLVLVLLFSLVPVLIGVALKSLQIKRELDLFIEVPNERCEEIRTLSLTASYVESGYDYMSFDTGLQATSAGNAAQPNQNKKIKYIMSHAVNEHLYSNMLSLRINNKKFALPKSLRRFIPFALKKFLKGEAAVTNGKKWKQLSDIYTHTDAMHIQRTDYFTNLCTNELVYKKIKNLDGINDIFYGCALVECNENGNLSLCNLSESQCADIIGVNTLAITKDNYLIINRQGARSFVSRGKCVPSGSGSAERLKRGESSFNALLEREMERELREELNLDKSIKVSTQAIAYARLVEKGGKADFFGISYIDECQQSIWERLLSSKEIKQSLMAMPTAIKLPSTEEGNVSIDDLYAALDGFIDENRSACSVQLEITRCALAEYREKRMELIHSLRNSFALAKKISNNEMLDFEEFLQLLAARKQLSFYYKKEKYVVSKRRTICFYKGSNEQDAQNYNSLQDFAANASIDNMALKSIWQAVSRIRI